MISLSEYEEFVCSLMSPASTVDFNAKLATAGLGCSGEAGEVADIVKKVLFHGMEFNEEIKTKLIKELGDLQFYITFAAIMVCGVSLQDIIDKNFDKLSDRYKSGKFSVQEFLDKERKKSE